MSKLDTAMARFRNGFSSKKIEDVGQPPESAQLGTGVVLEDRSEPIPSPTPLLVKEPVSTHPTTSFTPEKPAFPASVTVDVLSSSEARKYAEAKAKQLGVPIPGCPTAPDMDLPPDITCINSDELGRLLGKYTAFSSYLEVQVALLGIDSHCAESTLDYVRSKTLLSDKVQRTYDKAAEKRALCDTDMGVVKLQVNVSKVKAEYEMVSALLRACEKCASTVSREISRRSALAGLERSGRTI